MNKLDIRQRITFPAVLATFLDELQTERRLPSRRLVLLEIVREARRRHNHAKAQAKYRSRREEVARSGHSEATR